MEEEEGGKKRAEDGGGDMEWEQQWEICSLECEREGASKARDEYKVIKKQL